MQRVKQKEFFMKNKKTILVVLALTLVLGIMACATTGDPSTGDSTSGEETIVCLGDSLTAGANATVVGKDDKSKSWPAFLQNKVNIPVINAGVSGNTTAQGLARVKRDVLSKNPRIVIILLGGNDYQKISLATSQKNLQKIIDMVNDGKRKIYLVIFFPGWPDQARMFIRLASSNNIELIRSLWDGFVDMDKEHISADGMHPNAKGYELMADNIFNALKPYLEANNLLK
jgi:acyl-CoA thioesterase-1